MSTAVVDFMLQRMVAENARAVAEDARVAAVDANIAANDFAAAVDFRPSPRPLREPQYPTRGTLRVQRSAYSEDFTMGLMVGRAMGQYGKSI